MKQNTLIRFTKYNYKKEFNVMKQLTYNNEHNVIMID